MAEEKTATGREVLTGEALDKLEEALQIMKSHYAALERMVVLLDRMLVLLEQAASDA